MSRQRQRRLHLHLAQLGDGALIITARECRVTAG